MLLRSIRKVCVDQSRSFSLAAVFNKCGQPDQVVKLEKAKPIDFLNGTLEPHQVSVKMIAAPINPSDLNTIEGVYGVKATFPAIGGNEGVGAVVRVGSAVKDLLPGDLVIPHKVGFGTWRQEAIAEDKDVIKIPNDLPKAYAASIGVNPCTAYRLLLDFELLHPGDYIIQNGANSMVGLAVIQLAREMGIKTINVVRSDRPDVSTTLAMLANLGGDINIPDTYLNSPQFKEIVADIKTPIKLGLNCIGGESANDMARLLSTNATLVTYGGMSRRPFSVAPEILSYKQLKLKGFWISEWNKTHSKEERTEMLNDIADLIRKFKLTFFFQVHDFDDFSYALQKAQTPYELRKVILDLNFPDRLKEHDAKTASVQSEKHHYGIFNSEAN